MERSKLKKSIKYWLRYNKFRFFAKKSHLDNLYLATIQKAGSQWLKAVFSDPRIKVYTGLTEYPQHHYDGHEFHVTFPRYTFIPGFYIAYSQYKLFLKKPENYRTLFIARDPRNIVVSWYNSTLTTHAEIPEVKVQREQLKQMTQEEGIAHGIKILANKFAELRTWYELAEDEDPNVMFIRFEDITKEPFSYFQRIFKFFGIAIPDEELKAILEDYSKENMRKRDLERRAQKEDMSNQSHYRKKGSNHKQVFTEEHYKLFYGVTGDLVDVLGYER